MYPLELYPGLTIPAARPCQLWPSDDDDDDEDNRNCGDDEDDRNGDETRDHPTMGIQYCHLFTHVFIFLLVSLTTRILLK